MTASSFGGRADTWQIAFDTFEQHPLFGIGSGAFRTPGLEKQAHNVALRSQVRNAIRKVLKTIQTGNKEAAKAEFMAVVPQIDRMATKGILRKNRAAHYKSQINARLRAMP